MATNGDLKRWVGDVPSTKEAHDFVRLNNSGKVPGMPVKLYKHSIVYASSGKNYNMTLISNDSTPLTSAADIPWSSCVLCPGEAPSDAATEGMVVSTIKLGDGSRKLVALISTSDVVTTTVVALTGAITDVVAQLD